MRIVYICHPISGDIYQNHLKVRKIIRDLNMSNPDIVPFAPYLIDLLCMDDCIPEERARGIRNDEALFRAKFIDEVWLYGDRISIGMQHEIELANELGIPVISKSDKIKLK